MCAVGLTGLFRNEYPSNYSYATPSVPTYTEKELFEQLIARIKYNSQYCDSITIKPSQKSIGYSDADLMALREAFQTNTFISSITIHLTDLSKSSLTALEIIRNNESVQEIKYEYIQNSKRQTLDLTSIKKEQLREHQGLAEHHATLLKRLDKNRVKKISCAKTPELIEKDYRDAIERIQKKKRELAMAYVDAFAKLPKP